MVKIIQIFGPKTIHCYIILGYGAKIILLQFDPLIFNFVWHFPVGGID